MAVFWEPKSFSLFEIARGALNSCRVLWVVGWSPDPADYSSGVLRRFGEALETTGLDPDDLAVQLRDRKVSGIATFTDTPLRLMASVAERLSLPFHSSPTAALLTDKYEQRSALQSGGVPVPRFLQLRRDDRDQEGQIGDFPFPCVLKPSVGAGSRDTFLVKNPEELVPVLDVVEDEDFVLEEYIADRPNPASRVGADIVSVETLAAGGCLHHIAVTGRFRFAPPFRETGSFLPCDLPPDELERVQETATAALRALGVEHGVTHTEVKLSPDGPRVVEVNGRLGGLIPDLYSALDGSSLIELVIRGALGPDVAPPPSLNPDRVAFCRWLVAPTDAVEVSEVCGLKEVANLPGVQNVSLTRRVGDQVNAREGGLFGHVAAVSGAALNHEALRRLVEDIDATARFSFRRM